MKNTPTTFGWLSSNAHDVRHDVSTVFVAPRRMMGHATECSAIRNPPAAGIAGNSFVRSLR
jgi:hypothetical protein